MIEGTWSLRGNGICGWAASTESADPLWLELVSDGEVLGICRADLPEPRKCGFWLPVPEAWLEEGAPLAVRVANTAEYLPSEQPQAQAAEARSLTGDLFVDRGLHISGWVLDPDRSDHKLAVRALVDDREAAATVAGERRYRPLQADGHGFSLELPETLADGVSHVVRLLDEKDRPLPGSPFRIACHQQKASEWLRSQKKSDKALREMLAGLCESMEERLPGLIHGSKYEYWKKAFPPVLPGSRQKATLRVYGRGRAPTGQQGVDLRFRDGEAEFVLFLAPGQSLHPAALASMIATMRERQAALVYADSENRAGEPCFKPAWEKELFLVRDYLGPFLLRANVLRSAGIQPGDSQAAARFRAVMAADAMGKILHLPVPLSVTDEEDQSGREAAVAEWLADNQPGARQEAGRIIYPLPRKPRISIIIPTRDHADLLRTCLTSLARTDWPDYEILIIDNGTQEAEALDVLRTAAEDSRVCILDKPGVFNYAYLNNEAAARAAGEFLCFLNNDTEIIDPGWLKELAMPALWSDSGCVGARLVWPNGLVQHGGVIIGTHQLAAHVGNQWLEDEPGYMGRNQMFQQYSAVTAACLLTPKKLFLDSGGFDGRRFPVAFNDADYCLRLREKGKKIFWTPFSRLLHHESASRGKDLSKSAKARSEREMNFFRASWGHYPDPFYNPNLPLSAAAEPFAGLAFPPRSREAR